ncbi:MAG: hypothetical protein ACT4QA_20355 [Panacagrimonas sp.]
MADKAFIDSSIWLYAFLHDGTDDPRRAIAVRLIADSRGATISTQVIREVCANLLKKAHVAETRLRQVIRA